MATSSPVVVKTTSSTSAIARAQSHRPAHKKDVTMLLRCCTASLLLLVIGCVQCLNVLSDDCLKSSCEFHSDVGGEAYTTRLTFKVVDEDQIVVAGFTSQTVNTEGTVVSRVNVTFEVLDLQYDQLRREALVLLEWVTNSPFVEDFWLGTYQFLHRYYWRGVSHMSVHVYNMSVNQTHVSKLRAFWMVELELTGSSWPSTSGLTLELKYLKKLSLADNRIEELHPSSLEGCPNLEVLDLSRNKISSSNVVVSLKPVRATLKELNLAQNIMRRFENSLWDLSWNIKKLNLSYNKMNSVALYSIREITEIDLSFNNITDMSHQYYFKVDRMVLAGQNISSLSEVRTILSNIDREMFEYSIRNVELVYENRLPVLYVPQSQCTVDRKYIHCLDNGPNNFPRQESTFIHLEGNSVKMPKFSKFEIWPENLLDLSENDLKVLEDVPAQISGTKHLNLSRNSIGYISRHLLENMTQLTVLDLSFNQLKYVQLILYSPLFMLDISNNCLNRANISHSSSKYITEYLNLSYNSFTNILKAEWSQFDHFSKVDLGENSFECCGPQGQHSRVMFLNYQLKILNINSSKALTCVRPFYGRVEMTDTWLSEDHCQFKLQGWVVFGCMMLLLPLIIHAVDLVDYFMHQTERDLAERLIRLRNQGLEEDENCALECKYDAFVCHSHKDARWVRYELLPNLENDRDGHRLCIHYRDFQLGSFIEENVEKAMNSSRKVIVVVTRSFLQSNWCKMELTFAWEKMVREGRNYIIVIEVDRIPKRKRPPILSYLMRWRTYLEWPEAPTDDVKQECWSRVRDALGKSLRDRGIVAVEMDC